MDAFVQSTDKNFMVPVGGAIVASPSSQIIEDLAKVWEKMRSIITTKSKHKFLFVTHFSFPFSPLSLSPTLEEPR